MKKKYLTAINALGEILVESKRDLEWKDLQIEQKTQEVTELKGRIAEIEQYLAELEAACGKVRRKTAKRALK